MSETTAKPFLKDFFLDLAGRPTAFLAGVGRSGTTWVEELINYRHDHRILFEPFWSFKVPICKNFHHKGQYLRSNNDSPDYVEPARRILAGRFRNEWADKFNQGRRIYWKRLIKDVRTNLLVHWLHVHFPRIPIVFMLRHPCAVALSQQKSGWRLQGRDFLDQPLLVEDFLQPHRDLIQSTEDDFEQKVISWCVNNIVPLRQFQRGQMLVVFYENLLTQPDKEVRRLLQFLKLPVTPEVFAQHKRPSALVRNDSAIVSGGDSLSDWQRHISASQIQRATQILHTFQLDHLYDGTPMPRTDADQVLKSATGSH